MQELHNLCDELIRTTSRLEKQSILERNKNNEDFKKLLKFLLDPNIVTGISEKRLHKHIEASAEPIEFDLFGLLDYVSSNNTGGNDILRNVLMFVAAHNDHADFIEKLVSKSLRLGVDAKTVNAVIPNLIPTFDVMLGTPIDKCKIQNGEWFSISQKLNGNRGVYVGGKMYSRQGKEIKGLKHITDAIESALNLVGFVNEMVLDGELIYKNVECLSDSEAFQIGTGIVNSNAEDKTELAYVIFDIIPRNEFQFGKSECTYMMRKHGWLAPLREELIYNEDVRVVPMFYEGRDQKQIWKWLDYAEQHDMEGIMLNLNTPYECKRTKNLIKVKKFFTCDVECTGMEEGSGSLAGTLGAIVCNYKGFPLKCGSGFTTEQRSYYWNHRDEIVGQIVEIKYKEETRNKNGGVSVQFPVFQTVRNDKTEESYN